MSTTALLTVVQALNDLTMLQAAVMPLVQRALASGQTEISNDDLAAASASLGGSIDALDEAIARALARDTVEDAESLVTAQAAAKAPKPL